MEANQTKLRVLVENIGDGELSAFITDEKTLIIAQDQCPNAVILHEILLADGESNNGQPHLASTADALLTLSSFMNGYEVEDLLMRMFEEGMKAGMQYAGEKSVAKPRQTGAPIHSPSLKLSQVQR